MKKYLNKIYLLAVTLLAFACAPKEEADKISTITEISKIYGTLATTL
mgnify:CR=1 FL=1